MNFKRYRDFAIVLLSLAVPFWFLRASMNAPAEGRVAAPATAGSGAVAAAPPPPSGGAASAPDRMITKIAAPIQFIAAYVARGLSGIWGDYFYLVDVKEDNGRLSAQNARLQERVRKLEAFEEENRRLKRLLELKQNIRQDVVSAAVVGKNTNEFFRVVRVTLDRESKDIQVNQPVLAQDGVVGTVSKIAGDTIDVRLVVDAGSGVDVVVQRTGARGFVSGTGDQRSYTCRVQYMQRTDEVEVGDLLVTSGVGKRFPKGIPVATVTEVVKRDFGLYQTVTASTAVDFSRLEEVLIVTSVPLDESPPGREQPEPKR